MRLDVKYQAHMMMRTRRTKCAADMSQILQVLTYCPPFTALLDALSSRLKADLAGKTPLLEAMIVFQREFHPTHIDAAPAPTPAQSSAPSIAGSGASTPRGASRNANANGMGAGRAGQRDAFVPENVYDAMKGNKRFDSMRVSVWTLRMESCGVLSV